MTDYTWHDENYDKRIQLTIDSSKIGELYDGTDSAFDSSAACVGYTYRHTIPSSRIGYKASTIKVKLGYYNTEWRIANMYIGHQADSGDVYDFDGNQVQVTFSGGYSGASVVTGGLWSDPIDIDISIGKPIVCAFYFSDASYDDIPLCSTVENYDLYYKSGNDSSTTDATGYSHSGVAGERAVVDQIVAVSGTGVVEDFPVLIHLSDQSGITNADVTNVFDELTSSGVLYDDTWNPNDKAVGITLSNGDLTATSTTITWKGVRSTDYRSSGKWYWEVKIDATPAGQLIIGIGTSSETLTFPGDNIEGYGYRASTGDSYHAAYVAYGDSYTVNDVVSIALDLDNNKIWWAKNGTWQASGVPASGTNPAYTNVVGEFYAMAGLYNDGEEVTANFGASSFTYTPPTGFQAGFSSAITNDKKIAVYTTSGTQDVQCYTEIEKWVTTSGSEEAWFWTKINELDVENDTILYLYYDQGVSDNINYVGDTGDYAATQVWDNNFVGVWHMAQNPLNGNVLDSTSYTNDGTPGGAMDTDDLVSAKVGDGLDFDGNDYLNCGVNSKFDISDNITLESVFYLDSASDSPRFLSKQYSITSETTTDCCYQLGVANTSKARFAIGGVFDISSYGNTLNDGYYHCFVGIYSKYDAITYLDNQILWSSKAYSTAIRTQVATPLSIGASYADNADWFMNGVIDETRISNIVRSQVWIFLTYCSNWDNLITFGAEEDKPVFIFNGYVQVQDVPAARTVYLYHRSTGALVGATVSNGSTGYFEIPTPFNDYHFVNILPELSEDYNIVVEDKIEQGS